MFDPKDAIFMKSSPYEPKGWLQEFHPETIDLPKGSKLKKDNCGRSATSP